MTTFKVNIPISIYWKVPPPCINGVHLYSRMYTIVTYKQNWHQVGNRCIYLNSRGCVHWTWMFVGWMDVAYLTILHICHVMSYATLEGPSLMVVVLVFLRERQACRRLRERLLKNNKSSPFCIGYFSTRRTFGEKKLNKEAYKEDFFLKCSKDSH